MTALGELQQALKAESDIAAAPEGWWTVKDYAAREGKSESQACRLVRALRKADPPVVEWKEFRVKGDFKTLPVVHYRWVA